MVQIDTPKQIVDDVRKGEIDMSYKGEHKSLLKQSMIHCVCLGEACHTTISEFAMTMCMKICSKQERKARKQRKRRQVIQALKDIEREMKQKSFPLPIEMKEMRKVKWNPKRGRHTGPDNIPIRS